MAVKNKEFRLKQGSVVLGYIRRFSSTEKFIFGILLIAAFFAVINMVSRINQRFLVEVPANGGELREGVTGLPRTINPIIAITDVDKDISALVYSGLMKYADGSIVPDVAQSYTISADGLTYDFILRKDVRFHDNTQLTADDIAFTIQKIQDINIKSPKRGDWAAVTVKVISPVEIQFLLKQPYSPFLTNTTVGIVPKHIWGNVSNEQFIFSDFNIRPVGSGPYKVSSIDRDSGGIPTKYTLESWSNFYAQRPHISKISFNFFNDEEKALAALDAGYIDSLSSLSASPAKRLNADTAQAYLVASSPLPRIFGVFFNQNRNPLLADKVVRQALDLSADRNDIVNNVLNGYGLALHGPLPAGMIATNSSSTNPGSTNISSANDSANLVAAQALLEKNGWRKNADGIYAKKATKTSSTTLAFELYTADTPELKQAADSVERAWNKLGAKVSIKVFESGDLYQNVIRTRNYDALLFGQQIGKDRDLYAFWHSSQRNAPGLNVSMYTNSKIDTLLNTIRSSTDDAARTTAYTQFDQIIRDDLPAVFLYSPNFIYAVPKALQGFSLHAITTPTDRWNSEADWYIATEKIWKFLVK